MIKTKDRGSEKRKELLIFDVIYSLSQQVESLSFLNMMKKKSC